jgi:hypothetical protein
MIDDLHELLALGGHTVSAISGGEARGFDVEVEGGKAHVVFAPALGDASDLPEDATETVILTLELGGVAVPSGTAVLDLLERRVHGRGGVALDSVREFCRKRGIRLEPGPWRYRDGLV